MPSPKTDSVRLQHMLDATQKALQFTQGRSRQDRLLRTCQNLGI